MGERIEDRLEGDYFSLDFEDIVSIRLKAEMYANLNLDVNELASKAIVVYYESTSKYFTETQDQGYSHISPYTDAKDYMKKAARIAVKRGSLVNKLTGVQDNKEVNTNK